MKRFLVVGLVGVGLLLLPSCETEQKIVVPPPAEPVKEAPPPFVKQPPVLRKWEPKDYDIFGRWEQPCSAVPMETAKFKRVELAFVDSKVVVTTTLYSGAQCEVATRISDSTEEVIFEDGWYPALPLLNGNPEPGWRGLYLTGAERTECDVVVHLVEENTKRIMYIHWSPTKPVELDRAKHRWEFLGAL